MSDVRAEAEVDIDAPIERVWGVMLDVAQYPAWNPFIVRVDAAAPVVVGTRLELHVRWGNGGGVVSPEQVTRIEPPAAAGAPLREALLEYRFIGLPSTLGLVRGARIQALAERAGGGTRYRTHESFRGLLTAFVPIARVRDGFARHARALKERAESLVK